ncbi:MAG: CHAT domain-containing protein [Planctomycetota bacterium]
MRELSLSIEEFRQPFTDVDVDQNMAGRAEKAGQDIRRRLWVPIEEHLDGIDTVILSPDTVLGTLPIAALPGNKMDSFLLEEYRFASLPIARQLPEILSSRSDESGAGLLIVGNVDYNANAAFQGVNESAVRGAKTRTWDSLNGFGEELRVVQDLHRQVFGASEAITTLSGDGANEAAFLAAAPEHQTLHVITHGFFESPDVKSIQQAESSFAVSSSKVGVDPFLDTRMPGLLSGLVLAGANIRSEDSTSSQDGVLRASEIETASMQGVDLVVLSACETGLGAVAGGEGLTGLQRAFQVAGARSVVASLWQVEDRSTQELMKRFYDNLWQKKMSKLDALREAQLWLLNHPDFLEAEGVKDARIRGGVRPLPDSVQPQATRAGRTNAYFWAAFQLSGDWR